MFTSAGWTMTLIQDNRLFSSFRRTTPGKDRHSQVDVGGLLPGTTQGQYSSSAVRVQTRAAGHCLTSTLSPTITNDLRLSYLWNWWGWGTGGIPPQTATLGGAVEIADPTNTDAETSATAALIPYNVEHAGCPPANLGCKDYMIRDDVSWLHGNQLDTVRRILSTQRRLFRAHRQRHHDQQSEGLPDRAASRLTLPTFIQRTPD